MKVAYFLSALDLLIIFSLYFGGTCSGFAGIVPCIRHGRILGESGEEGGGDSSGGLSGGTSGNGSDATNAAANAAAKGASNGDASGGHSPLAGSSGSEGRDPVNSQTPPRDPPTTDAQNSPPGSGGQTGDHNGEAANGEASNGEGATEEAENGNYDEQGDEEDGEEYEDAEDDDSYGLHDIDENANLCLENNGGCGNDKICENLGKGIVKCLCKPGYKLLGTDCVESSKSSSLNSFFCWFLLLIIVLASIN